MISAHCASPVAPIGWPKMEFCPVKLPTSQHRFVGVRLLVVFTKTYELQTAEIAPKMSLAFSWCSILHTVGYNGYLQNWNLW